jgi:hypothetical protein
MKVIQILPPRPIIVVGQYERVHLQGTTNKHVQFYQPKEDSWVFFKSSSKKYYKGQPTTIIGHVLTLDLLNIYIGLNGGAIGHVFST